MEKERKRYDGWGRQTNGKICVTKKTVKCEDKKTRNSKRDKSR